MGSEKDKVQKVEEEEEEAEVAETLMPEEKIVESTEGVEEEEETPRSKKKGKGKPKAEDIVEDEISKYPDLSKEKIEKRLAKKHDINDTTLKIVYDRCHKFLAKLKANGKMS